jgi:hypothetical protein
LRCSARRGLVLLLAQVRVVLHRVALCLVGEEAHAVAHRDVAAVLLEFGHAAVVDQHGDAILVDALRLRPGLAIAVARPLAALEPQHVVVDVRLLRRPAVAEVDLLAVVRRLDLQRHGELLGDVDVPAQVVVHDAGAVEHP